MSETKEQVFLDVLHDFFLELDQEYGPLSESWFKDKYLKRWEAASDTISTQGETVDCHTA